MNIVKDNYKISSLINLQINTDVYHGTTATAIHVDLVYMHKFTCLFVDRIYLYINCMDI